MSLKIQTTLKKSLSRKTLKRSFRQGDNSNVPLPTPSMGLITSTADGSVGQTYTLNAAWTNIQWYRRSVIAPFTLTLIVGATSANYIAQAADVNCFLVCVGNSGSSTLAALTFQTVLSAPVLLESFDSMTGFVGTNGNIALNTVNPAQGTGMMEFVPGGAALSPSGTKTNAFSLTAPDLTTDSYAFVIDFGNINTFDEQLTSGCSFQLAESGSSSYVTVTNISGPTGLASVARTVVGKMWWSVNAPEVPGYAAFVTGLKNLRMQSNQILPYSSKPKVDAACRNARGRPKLIMWSDDIRPGQLQYMIPLLTQYKLEASWAVPFALVGLASRLTVSDLHTIENLGHAIALNITKDDDRLLNKISLGGNVASVTQEYTDGVAWLASNGFNSKGGKHGVWSNGEATVNATPITKSGVTTTTGSPVISGIADTTGITVGMAVVGYNIPSGTTVLSIVTNTSVTVSNNLTTGTTFVKFVDNSGVFHGTGLRNSLIAAGLRTGRTTITSPRTSFYDRFGLGDNGLWLPGTGMTGLTNLTMRTEIQNAINRGETLHTYTHDWVVSGNLGDPNPSINVSVANGTDWIQWIAARRDAGELDVLNVINWGEQVLAAGVPF